MSFIFKAVRPKFSSLFTGTFPARTITHAVRPSSGLLNELVNNRETSSKLYGLEDLSHVSVPTLVKSGRFTARQPWTSTEDFTEVFDKDFPLFKDLDLANIAVAGGVIVDAMIQRSPKDIDLFVIAPEGIDDRAEWTRQRIERFITEIYEVMKSKNSALNKRKQKPSFRVDSFEFFDLEEFTQTLSKHLHH